MEVKCPKCQAPVMLAEGPVPIICSRCGEELEIAMGGEGFALMASAGKSHSVTSDELSFSEDDPVLLDHARWRLGAGFACLFGLSSLAVMTLMTVGDYRTYGRVFFEAGSNRWLLGIAVAVCALCVVGGGLIFIMVGRETRRYKEAVKRRLMAKTSQDSHAPMKGNGL